MFTAFSKPEKALPKETKLDFIYKKLLVKLGIGVNIITDVLFEIRKCLEYHISDIIEIVPDEQQ